MTIRRGSRMIFGVVAVVGVVLCARPAGWSQMPSTGILSQGSTTNRAGRHGADDDMDPVHLGLSESYLRTQSAERQRKLVSDTERLLYLSNQLKAAIADAGSETLTPEMLRQMDEIEKLARSVKNKMRN